MTLPHKQESDMDMERHTYDYIVCGSGSAGSVVARRLAENPDVTVLLVEAGGDDEVPQVSDASRWAENLGGERDWAFATRPNPHLGGRSLLCSMGKVLGGSSSINLMVWARGHRSDWDAFAEASGDAGWNYASVLDIYRRIENWQGVPDPQRRGHDGDLFVQTTPAPNPTATALMDAARAAGIAVFADANGAMMEGAGGAALSNLRIRDGKRQSVFGSYVRPWLGRANLTVWTHARVARVTFSGRRATGVEVLVNGARVRVEATRETVLSLGAVQTPTILMQSGIGDARHLRAFGIAVVENLPGVGRHLQEHVLLGGCVWEYATEDQFRGSGPEATFFHKTRGDLDAPDIQGFLIDGAFVSAELADAAPARSCWSITPGLVRPRSRGRILLTGARPGDPPDIDTRILSDPADLEALLASVELARELGNSAAFGALRAREALPGPLGRAAMARFVRNAAVPFWHYACTARMGNDEFSVVDARLRVHGIDRLRVADASIMPRVTTGNTMAPCVVIGERAAAMILEDAVNPP
ncbi:MAG: GMC family oxidoreductase N-terminal domain-containing protein [Luteibacter sp.]